ncbi:MAG: pilus assembly FimT family protein [Candidatus Acidiferrales bacterium]
MKSDAGSRGFSFIETLAIVGITLILGAFAIFQLSPALQQEQANSAMNEVAGELRTARQTAITERRNIQIQFLPNNQIQLTRMDLPTGANVLATVTFPGPVRYALTAGMPDTPDGFGNKSAIVFGGLVGGPPTMLFMSDGTFVNTSGNALNGTVFLAIPGMNTAARAITVVGATGRIRTYSGQGKAWR